MEKLSGDIQSEYSETNITWLEPDQITKEILDRKQCEQFWQQFPRSWNKREEDIFFKWPSVWTDSCGTHRKSTDALKQTQSQNWQFTKKSRKMKINVRVRIQHEEGCCKKLWPTRWLWLLGYITVTVILLLLLLLLLFIQTISRISIMPKIFCVMWSSRSTSIFLSQTGPSLPCVTNREWMEMS